MLEIMLGAGLCVIVLFVISKHLKTSARRSAFFDGIFGTPMDLGKSFNALFNITAKASEPFAEVVVEVVAESPVVHKPKAPNRGNIRPMLGEETDPDVLPKDVHVFPDTGIAPATVFEDFNKRLFVHTNIAQQKWPETTQDDFPTRLFIPTDKLADVCKTHLRPGYPVIIDHYGWWRGASSKLEMDNDYSDAVVGAYMALPPSHRPPVVSSLKPEAEQALLLLRYGFEPLEIKLPMLQPHVRRSLDYLLSAMIGPRKDWLWFSVARMRKSVAEAFAQEEAAKARVQAEIVKVEEAEKAILNNRHANRFAAIWDMPEEAARPDREDLPPAMDEAADPTTATRKRARRIVVADEEAGKPVEQGAEA